MNSGSVPPFMGSERHLRCFVSVKPWVKYCVLSMSLELSKRWKRVILDMIWGKWMETRNEEKLGFDNQLKIDRTNSEFCSSCCVDGCTHYCWAILRNQKKWPLWLSGCKRKTFWKWPLVDGEGLETAHIFLNLAPEGNSLKGDQVQSILIRHNTENKTTFSVRGSEL